MNVKRFLPISLIVLSLSVITPIGEVTNADDTYERICLTYGWTSCGNWSIYNASGNQVNQVVGPGTLSAFTSAVRCQTSGVNLCGDSSVVPLGYAVLNYLYSPSTPTTTPTPTPSPSSTPSPSASATDTTYQNVCLPAGWTACGLWIIYANSGSENNRIVGPSSLSALTATIGCRTSGVNLCMDNQGNPATGYAILSGTYQSGIFISNSLPIITRSPSPSPTPNSTSSSDTRTATSQTDTRTATTQTTSTNTNQSETRTAQIAKVASISNVKERTAATVDLIKTFNSIEKENSLDVTFNSKKSSVIVVDLGVPGIPVVITATKKGSPTITLKSTTDADGDTQIKTNKNLDGYSVTLKVNKTKIDTDIVKRKN